MIKTVQMDESVHALIIKKQEEITKKKGYYVQIKDIVEKLIRENIDNMEI